ncbi:hypothetical protein [Pedococcus sp. 5OH_020]|jgi:hypothetical protein|uniref:hypothetical protein n=1 Tax=Pedococcus sp. 5OH_020 TaxID=2989814 RepID=UPI0022E9F004|nr:hypothetical protein [Pedococcus sp. 5OH_020]
MDPSRHGFLHAALAGLGLGAAWGALARIWMRLVSTDPQFSWPGTLLIVLLGAVFGLLVGIAWRARTSTGWRRWLRLLAVPGLVLFAGQGLPLAPGFLVAGPLVRRRGLLPRGVAAAALVGPALTFWWFERFDDETMTAAPARVQLSFLLGMPVLATALAWAGHLVMGPLPASPQSDSPDRALSSRRSDSSLEAPAGPA